MYETTTTVRLEENTSMKSHWKIPKINLFIVPFGFCSVPAAPSKSRKQGAVSGYYAGKGFRRFHFRPHHPPPRRDELHRITD